MKQSYFKKTIYVFFTVILTLLLSFILHALVEIWYLAMMQSTGQVPVGTHFFGFGWCALPAWSGVTFLFLGLFGGVVLGFYWWDVVYIQKRHWRMQKKGLKDKLIK